MKTQRIIIILAMLVTATLWSCTPDNVSPSSGDTASNSTPTLSGDGVAHPTVPNVCSDSVVFDLIDEGGSTNINYCGAFPCDPNNATPWGSVTCFNTDSALYFNVQLAFGWYLELNKSFIGVEENMNIINGIPQTESGWIQQIVSPAVNTYQVSVPSANLSDCADIASIFSVVKLDFFGGTDQNSRRNLWLHNAQWNDPNATGANSGSMLVYPYCGLDCGASACSDVPEYCDMNFYCSSYEWIENVSIASINNTSGNNQGYGDYTAQEATIEAGSQASITLTPGFNNACGYYERWVVFIDWNRDGDFFDSGELVTWGAGSSAITRTFNVPANAEDCELRMRVAMRWGCWPAGPCCSYYYGEAEDYTIFVSGNNSGRVAPRVDDNVLQSYTINEKAAPGDVQLIEGEQLQLRSGSEQDLQVEVLDQNGNVVHTQTVKAKAGMNDVNLSFQSRNMSNYTYRVKGGLERSAAEMEMGAPAGME